MASVMTQGAVERPGKRGGDGLLGEAEIERAHRRVAEHQRHGEVDDLARGAWSCRCG